MLVSHQLKTSIPDRFLAQGGSRRQLRRNSGAQTLARASGVGKRLAACARGAVQPDKILAALQSLWPRQVGSVRRQIQKLPEADFHTPVLSRRRSRAPVVLRKSNTEARQSRKTV